MKSVHFKPEHAKFRNSVREFMQVNVVPHTQEWEKLGFIPKELFVLMGQAGFLGLMYPSNVGGQEKDIFYSAILLEELGRTGVTGFRVAIAVHTYMALPYIIKYGSTDLQQRYLQPAIAGTKICCLAITEPQAGTDLSNLITYATEQEDHYLVNGNKKFVANGKIADFIIADVKTGTNSRNLSLLVIDANSPGIQINKLDTYNWRSSNTCEIIFDNVLVPKNNLIGSRNMGFVYIMQCMQLERIAAGMLAIGGIDCCLDYTWEYISNRSVSNIALSKYQTIRHKLADLIADNEALRQFAYHVAWLYAQQELPIAEASMLKLRATELASKAAVECIQFFGAHGCMLDAPISRIFQDAQAGTIAGGASEIMRDIIAQITLEESGWRRKPSKTIKIDQSIGEMICH